MGDPLQDVAEQFFATAGTRFVSPLTLVELCSVYSRIIHAISIPAVTEVGGDIEKLEALVRASLIDCGLSPVALPISAEWSLGNRKIRVPVEYAEARRLAGDLRLRTLDLLHVAYSSLLLKTGTPIEEFVTGDDELLSRSKRILELTEIRVVPPHKTRPPRGA